MSAKKLDLNEFARTFSMLSDPKRLTILASLADGPKNVKALVKIVDVRQSLVSHHLGLLRMSGLVTSERSGREVAYTITPDALADAAEFLNDLA
jgi:DNA-binding transcriptional ArsR family regulator